MLLTSPTSKFFFLRCLRGCLLGLTDLGIGFTLVTLGAVTANCIQKLQLPGHVWPLIGDSRSEIVGT